MSTRKDAFTRIAEGCHALKERSEYRELGTDFLDKLNAQRLARQHAKRLLSLSYSFIRRQLVSLDIH